MEIIVEDNDLNGFNTKAKEQLVTVVNDYVDEVIRESYRIEASRNSTKRGTPEITSSMVHDAVSLICRGLVPRRNLGIKVIKVLAMIFLAISGFLYDPIKLQNSIYMTMFIIVITIAILCGTISTIKE